MNQSPYPPVSSVGPMDFKTAVIMCFQKYADFNGRASRAEYWWFVLATFLISCLTSIIPYVGTYLSGIISLALLVPSLAVAWRRLHDTGRGGGWWFINFVPLVGTIIFIVFCCQPSEPEPNRFGYVPMA